MFDKKTEICKMLPLHLTQTLPKQTATQSKKNCNLMSSLSLYELTYHIFPYRISPFACEQVKNKKNNEKKRLKIVPGCCWYVYCILYTQPVITVALERLIQ